SSPASPTIATSLGPTLAFKVSIEGRPQGNQATRLFVGIMEGSLTVNPKFLLSFTVDMPASGEYGNLSLAGLNPGTRYSALLKGSNQIAASSAFTMSPAVTNLNEGEPLTLTAGDLNEDNVINTADYSIAQKAFGATAKSSNWNNNVDFNSDGIINTFDLSIIIKNIGQTGASGAWTSPLPKVATASAGLANPPIGSPNDQPGHWIWIPTP
ncbi:MAG: dockerin type I domain-containing protein, partial [Candidatus Daviesbacteria bacterium]|nr:dockerin type I domain-containing protein [Candidatus Daviesbacteria bacterium]